jgi:hypothetical protein
MSLLDQVEVTPKADTSQIEKAIDRIIDAGFQVVIQPGDRLLVSPRAKLSEKQVAWITQNKAAILAYFRENVATIDHVQGIQEAFNATIASISTLNDPEKKVAPEPAWVRCTDCSHGMSMPGDEAGSVKLCEKGHGGRFGFQKHLCTDYVAVLLH